MLSSIRGTVIEVGHRSLIIENQGLGYEILVSDPKSFHVNQDVFIYLYHHKREDGEFLVGLTSKEERSGFRLLLNVNGIGPKTALSILSKISYSQLLTAISNNNFELIESLPGISSHMASQIFLDLKEHISRNVKSNVAQYKEVKDALKNIGFKSKEIDKVLPSIYIANGSTQEIIREALRRLQNAKVSG
jgi:Holliday junction DNA helicase RuvA